MYLSECAKINQTKGAVDTLNKEVSVFQLAWKHIQINTHPNLYLILHLLICWIGFGINNRTTLISKTLASIIVTDKKERTYSYLDLVRTPNMRKLACCTGLLWCVFSGSLCSLIFFWHYLRQCHKWGHILTVSQQVLCCCFVLWHQLQHYRFWPQYISDPVHLCNDRGACQSCSLLPTGQDWQKTHCCRFTDNGCCLSWNQHRHTQT